MKIFKPYYAILDGFEFTSGQDRENALWAALWASQARGRNEEILPPFRPPMIAILGPHGVGKSTLAHKLSDLAGSQGVMAEIDQRTLDHLAMMNSSVARFDDVAFTCESSRLLCRFLAANKWLYRPLRQKERVSVALNCITIITTTANGLPADLKKRAIIIRLEKSDKPQPVQATEKRGGGKPCK